MATFRVGQRVRIIGADYRPELIGCTATVVSPLADILRDKLGLPT